MHTPPNGPPQLGTAGLWQRGGSVLPPQVTAMPCNAAWKSPEVETVLSLFEDCEVWKVLGEGTEMKGFAFRGVEREAKGGGEGQGNRPGAMAAWEGCAGRAVTSWQDQAA